MNQYCYNELKIGDEHSFLITITEDMMIKFLQITGDKNPLHCNEAYAKSRGYPSCVVYGLLTSSFLSTLAGLYLPGKYSLIHSVETRLVQPVFVGDCLRVCGIITEKHDVFHMLKLKVSIIHQHTGKKVVRGNMQVSVMDEGMDCL